MAKLKIRTHPDPVLKKKAAPVADFGPAMQKLFDDMIDTMHVSDGVGLAAPQIGLSHQIFIVCPTMRRGEEYVMVNAAIDASGFFVLDSDQLFLHIDIVFRHDWGSIGPESYHARVEEGSL